MSEKIAAMIEEIKGLSVLELINILSRINAYPASKPIPIFTSTKLQR